MTNDNMEKSIALGTAAFLLGSGAAWAAEPAAVGAAYVENSQDAPMPLPLTEAHDDLYHEMLTE